MYGEKVVARYDTDNNAEGGGVSITLRAMTPSIAILNPPSPTALSNSQQVWYRDFNFVVYDAAPPPKPRYTISIWYIILLPRFTLISDLLKEVV